MIVRFAMFFVVLFAGVAHGQDVADRLLASTRLIVGVQLKQVKDTPLVKRNGDRLRAVFADWTSAIAHLGIDPAQVDRMVVAVGEDYPKGTAIVILGKIDPAKVDAKMQQHIRDRRFAVRPFRQDDKSCYSLETPVGLNPIPGLPVTTFVSARQEGMVIAFDELTLAALLRLQNPDEAPRDRFANYKAVLEGEAGIVGVLLPPETLTAANALLAGVKAVELEVTVTDSINAKTVFRLADGTAFQPRLKSGIDQAKQLFPPMAMQQGIDPKLTQFIVELLGAAKVEQDGKDVTLMAELSGDAVGRLLRK
jgi:hypothetical protein